VSIIEKDGHMVSSKFSVPTDDGIEPLALSVDQTARATGESRSQVYNRIGLGHYEAIKSGARTLILFESIKRHFASLPRAKIKPPKPRKPRTNFPVTT
jgi:hypothetical protein